MFKMFKMVKILKLKRTRTYYTDSSKDPEFIFLKRFHLKAVNKNYKYLISIYNIYKNRDKKNLTYKLNPSYFLIEQIYINLKKDYINLIRKNKKITSYNELHDLSLKSICNVHILNKYREDLIKVIEEEIRLS